MAKVVMRRFVPFPKGMYNLQILKYEEKESNLQAGQYYYTWTIRVLDALPEEFTGRDTFTVLTPTNLTEKNALRKFLNRVGFTDIQVDDEIDLDALINYRFVGSLGIKTAKNGNDNNELVDVSIAEYDKFLERQRGGNRPPQAARSASAPRVQTAPQQPQQQPQTSFVDAPAAAQTAIPRTGPVQQQPATNAGGPPVGPTVLVRPTARPVPAPAQTSAALVGAQPRRPAPTPMAQPVQTVPVVDEPNVELPEGYDDGTASFPAQSPQ